MKQQLDEFLTKELQMQEKITRGRDEIRKLEDRSRDDAKVVENLKGINQRLKDDMERMEKEHAKQISHLTQVHQQALIDAKTNKDAIYTIEGDTQKENYVPIRNRSASTTSRRTLNMPRQMLHKPKHQQQTSTDTVIKCI